VHLVGIHILEEYIYWTGTFYTQDVSEIGHILDTCSVDQNKEEYPIAVSFHSIVKVKVKFVLNPTMKA
jgi:hypothetical protein